MGLVAKASGGEYKLVGTGAHPARCIRIIDLGTQDVEYKGEVQKKHQIRIGFELYDENVKIGDQELPAMAWFSGTLSLNEKSKLGPMLEGWRGRKFTAAERDGFDIKTLLGIECIINIVYSEDGKYANIASVSQPMKGLAIPAAVAEQYAYEVEMGREGTWEKLGKKTQEKIEKSYEFVPEQESITQIGPIDENVFLDIDDSDLPF